MLRAETNIERHDHVVHFYRGDDDLAKTAAAYLAEAIGAGGNAVAITSPSHRLSIGRQLTALGIDVQGARDGGQLVFQDAEATLAKLIVDGKVNREAFDREVGGLIRSTSDSAQHVRAYGEMVDLLWQVGDIPGAIELEALWNELIAELQFPLLCAYRSAAVAAPEHEDALRDICRLHTSVSPTSPAELAAGRTLDGAPEVSREFQPERHAPYAARRFVEEVLKRFGYSRSAIEDAQLVISELVSNAVIHARSPLSVSISPERAMLRLAVADQSGALPPLRASSSVAADGGRGLSVVASLAQDWGAVATEHGKVVWAELAASG